MKVSRIIKRRTLAKEALDNGMILIAGHPLKPSYDVKIGDLLYLNFPNKKLKIKVSSLEESVNKEKASFMYEVLV